MDNLYFVARKEFASFGQKLANHMGLEMKLFDHWRDMQCEIGFFDYLYTFLFTPIDFKDKCQVIASPDLKMILSWDNKLKQKEKFEGKLLIPKYYTMPKLDILMQNFNGIEDKVCITQTISRAGKQTLIFEPEVHDGQYLSRKTNMFNINNPIIINEFIEKEKDVSFNIVIFEDGYIFVTPPVEQSIVGGHLFSGGKYPAELSDHIRGNIQGYGKIIGKEMYMEGYRGVAGIDCMVKDDDLYFTEVTQGRLLIHLV